MNKHYTEKKYFRPGNNYQGNNTYNNTYNNTLDTLHGLHIGDRGDNFKTLISSILKKAEIKQKYITALTSEASMELYSAAFTSEFVDEEENYEVYEQLGDLSGNKFIVDYFYRRFPQLRCKEGVKVVARLRINYGSKKSFCKIAENLGFWPFISAPHDLRQRKKKPLLEDVFEAFLGVTEHIFDKKLGVGRGYTFIYKILEKIFDDMDISLRYEDLYDPKTRLKELFDMYDEQLGPLAYEDEKKDLITHTIVYRVKGANFKFNRNGKKIKNKFTGGTYIKIGQGSASLQADARQHASDDALKTLAYQNYIKHPPSIYRIFAEVKKGEEIPKPKVTPDDVERKYQLGINSKYSTRKKNIYQLFYESTPLAMYCCKRNWHGIKSCLELGANPNETDSEGMTCTDLLLIGKRKRKFMKVVLSAFLKRSKTLIVSKNIYTAYYTKYAETDEESYRKFFKKIGKKIVILDKYL